MATAKELLKFKGNTRMETIAPDSNVLEAIRRMAEADIGSLIVMEDSVILGIVTERDYARKIVLEGRSSSDTPVREIMRTNVRCVAMDSSVDDCRAIMTKDGIRYVPVVKDGYLAGLVSIGDVISHAISEKDYLIDQLTMYITGTQTVKMRN